MKAFSIYNKKNIISRTLAILSFVFSISLFAGSDTGTLYTKDGSVLQGEIIRDTTGNYIVYSNYGESYVKAEDVIVLMKKDEKTAADVVETFILSDDSMDVISIFQKEMPERKEGDKTLNLLVPGTVQSIYDQENAVIPFTFSDLGNLSKINIDLSNYASKGKKIFIVTKQKDAVEIDEEKNFVFKYQFTPENEISFKLLLKFPKTWKISSSDPQLTKQYNGLAVWNINLKRQSKFSPVIKFKPE